MSAPPVTGPNPNPVAAAVGAAVGALPSPPPPLIVGDDEEPGALGSAGAGVAVGGAVGCSASPVVLPSAVVGEALVEESGDGGTVLVPVPVGEEDPPPKLRSPPLGLAVGADDPPELLSPVVVGEALAEKVGDGDTVAAAKPAGEGVMIPEKPRSPGLGLAVGAKDRRPPSSKFLSSVVVGVALAENISNGDTVAAASLVGDGVTPEKSRSPGLGLAVGEDDRGPAPPESP